MNGALRTHLLEWRQSLSLDLGESITIEAIKKTTGQFNLGMPILPPPLADLQTLRAVLANVQRDGCPPSEWPLGLLRTSGWIILDPAYITLVNDPTLCANYLSAVVMRGGVSGGRILLYSYLRFYPQGHHCLELMRAAMVRLLTQGEASAPRLRRATIRHSLLAPNGPAILAQHLLATDPGPYLAKIGLSGELARGRFVEAAWEYVATEFASFHPGEEFGPTLRVLLALSLDNSGMQLRFPERITDLAAAMVKPWSNRGTELPVGIRNLLFHHLGDPRRPNTAWSGVTDLAHEVVTQYLAGEVIEDFFTLLEAIAVRDPTIDRHHHQRRALWEFCREQGVLTDAWLAIGPSLLVDAQRCFSGRARHYAGLGTPTGARARHAVLLLRIAKMTVVEWSHSGSYYLWHPDNIEAPQCYQSHYTYESLERSADYCRSRHDDNRSDWRIDFLHHLATLTKNVSGCKNPRKNGEERPR